MTGAIDGARDGLPGSGLDVHKPTGPDEFERAEAERQRKLQQRK